MAELNQIFTRLQLKYDTLANWQAVKDTFVPLAGELCLAKVEVTDPANKLLQPVMAKVGDGTSTWGQLDWMSAKAADVYGWAKKATLDAADLPAIPVEKLPVDAIDTDLDTRYSITLDSDETNGDRIKIVTQLYSKGAASGDATTSYIDVVTPTEFATALASYYTKNDVDGMVSGKLHTEQDIRDFAADEINTLIGGVSDADTIKHIEDLINYVNNNGAQIAKLITDVGTANTNASNAVETANNANTTAGQALEKANEALEGAEGAAASAAAAKASEEAAKASEKAAKASENAAAGSATTAGEKASAAAASAVTAGEHAAAAAGSAQTANEHAGAAAGSAQTAAVKASEAAGSAADALVSEQNATQAKADAEAAKIAAVNAQAGAETAQEKAEDAQKAAEAAQKAAEGFKGEAEAAQAGAVAAKEAAEASNTSATAIANAAKATAEAAKTASDAVTEAVAGLHAIATSGSIYDVKEGANVSTGTDAGVKYLVFNCGTASTVI